MVLLFVLQDILNHVLQDLEEFMKELKDKSAAWAELEKISKRSKKKKAEGTWLYGLFIAAVHPCLPFSPLVF